MGEAPDIREQEDCPSRAVCGGRCDQHEGMTAEDERLRRVLAAVMTHSTALDECNYGDAAIEVETAVLAWLAERLDGDDVRIAVTSSFGWDDGPMWRAEHATAALTAVKTAIGADQ